MKQEEPLASKRIEDGKVRRKAVPRAAHAELGVTERGRNIVSLLEVSSQVA